VPLRAVSLQEAADGDIGFHADHLAVGAQRRDRAAVGQQRLP
jgi:hypothetical protein